VLTAVSIIPSAPVLVPELAGAAVAELSELSDAVRAAALALPQHWIAIGVDGGQQRRLAPDCAGTFAGYGADVRVALSPGPQEVADLPLCALIAAWLRGRCAPAARVETYCYPASLEDSLAVEQGRALWAQTSGSADPIGVLVVADGCNTLTASAPGGYDPASASVQRALDDALAGADIAALTPLPPEVTGRAAFGVLAGLAADRPHRARELYRGAPYGVGYFVGIWQP
jgi:hypothetical protein